MSSSEFSVIAVASGKGGVGKTLLSACLGTILSEQETWATKVLLVDLDFSVKGLTFLYGTANEWKSVPGGMIDIIRNQDKVSDLSEMIKIVGKVCVLAADVNFNEKVDWDKYYPSHAEMASSMRRLLAAANQENFRLVIFDTGAGIDKPLVALAENVDIMIIVVEPDEISVAAALDLRAELQETIDEVYFVVNKEPDEFPQERYEKLKDSVKLLPPLPFDSRMHTRFMKDARLLAAKGFGRTRYRRYVGSIVKDILDIDSRTPTIWDLIWRKKATRIFFQFLGYGLSFLALVAAVLIGIVYFVS